MRANMVFYFFTGGLGSSTAVAQSPIITVVNVNEPTQGRLSLSLYNDPSEMLITWTSKNRHVDDDVVVLLIGLQHDTVLEVGAGEWAVHHHGSCVSNHNIHGRKHVRRTSHDGGVP